MKNNKNTAMTTLILNYHGMTDKGGGNANLHCLPIAHFREQMHHLKQRGYSVVPWHEMVKPANAGLRIGFTFDDGRKSDLESSALLHSLGYSALFFIPTNDIGGSDFVNRADIVELRRLGMGIGSHSHFHVQLTPLGTARIVNELTTSKRMLEDIVGSPITHISFPGGSYDANILSIAAEAGYEYFYTSDWGVNTQRQYKSRVFRRTSLLNNVDIEQFESLVQLRHYYARQFGFQSKELIKRYLGEDRYFKFRQTLLRCVR
jgi:peptidoglycan/xylan/chitin deacetylase (PgdA/CDA1 family)